jgi:hypothetical protein
MQRPNARLFALLWCLRIVIALAGFALIPTSSFELKVGLPAIIQKVVPAFGTIVIVLALLPFLWFAVRRNQTWAKWVLFVAFVVSVLNFFLDGTTFQSARLPSSGVEFFSLLVEAVGFYFLMPTQWSVSRARDASRAAR